MPNQNPGMEKLEQALDRRILMGLLQEWEQAMRMLPPEARRLMDPPQFSLKDTDRRLGAWRPDRREICLSRPFVRTRSWDEVREVLLHETAHQVADEVLSPSEDNRPHGKNFKTACKMLGCVFDRASAATPLWDRVKKNRDNPAHGLLGRIQKLLALAESPNRHEAKAAMVKAHQLMARHNVDLIRAGYTRRFFSVFLGRPKLRRFKEEYHLANVLIRFYFVSGIWVPAFVLERGKMGRVLEISGTRSNIQIAAYVYDYVGRFIDMKWRQYNLGKNLGRYRKSDFALGVIEGFAEKLEAGREQARPAPDIAQSLVLVEDPQLTRYLKVKYPHTAAIRRKSSGADLEVMSDGVKTGQTLVISKGVSRRSAGTGLVIEDQTGRGG